MYCIGIRAPMRGEIFEVLVHSKKYSTEYVMVDVRSSASYEEIILNSQHGALMEDEVVLYEKEPESSRLLSKDIDCPYRWFTLTDHVNLFVPDTNKSVKSLLKK